MRYYELYETTPTTQGIYDKNQDRRQNNSTRFSRRPPLTLRHLNRLKHIRNARLKAAKEKLAFLPKIYGDPNSKENQLEQAHHEIRMVKDQIALEIEAAKIDQDKKDHISAMAKRAIERKRKP